MFNTYPSCFKIISNLIFFCKIFNTLGNDVTAPVAIGEMKKMNVDCVFCKDKIALVPDHFTPNKDIKSAELYKCVKDFAEENQITN